MNRAQLFPFFQDLSVRGREELGALVATKVPARKLMLRRGEAANGAYLVLAGALRVYYITEDGREATLYRVEPGQPCVLSLTATLGERAYPAWVQSASSGGTVVRVPNGAFHRLLNDEPAFRSFVLTAMSERVFELMSQLEQLATSTMVQRVAAFLIRHGAGNEEYSGTQAQLAVELGTAREVVVRALRTLSERGLVTKARGRVRIVDMDGLSIVASAPDPDRSR